MSHELFRASCHGLYMIHDQLVEICVFMFATVNNQLPADSLGVQIGIRFINIYESAVSSQVIVERQNIPMC